MSQESIYKIYKGVLAFKLENTKYAINFILHDDELLERCRQAGKDGIEQACFNYARKHNDEFGNRFILELYDVFWEKVWQVIQPNSKSKLGL